jgi:putative endonuclease
VPLRTAWVHIMASDSRTIYIGVTNDLERRVWEHKTHVDPGAFTATYGLTNLVYVEEYPRFDDAIAREKQLKGKNRAKKLALTAAQTPRWNDLAWNWFDPVDIVQDREHAAREKESATRSS